MKHIRFSLLTVALLLAVLLLNGCRTAPSPAPKAAANDDPAWQKLRQETLAQYRVVIDDDGCDMTEYPKDLPLTRENIYAQMLDAIKGTEVDTVSFCPFSVGHRLATRSLVTDVHTERAALDRDRNVTPELLALGTDTLQVAVEFCRKNNFKVWANFRVNDIHDSWYKQWMYGTKVAHPEQLNGTEDNPPPFGSWTSFDFALPVVRNRARDICVEFLSHYDVDGLEMDFYRFPVFFKSVAWGGSASEEEIEAMTQMMREIRAEADRIGRIRGRYLVVAARLPDSAPVARDAGLDIEQWMKEGLIDIFIAGGDGGYYNTYAGAVALGHKYGVKVFPSVDTSWMGGARSSIPGYVAQSAAALNAGADGLFYFNMFYAKAYIPHMKRKLDDLRLKDKTYFGYYQRTGSFTTISKKTVELDELKLVRGDKMYLGDAAPATYMEMEIGDDFSRPEVLEKKPQLTLKVETGLQEQYAIHASVNGHALGDPVFSKGDYLFDVAPAFVVPGSNRFDFTIDDGTLAAIPPRVIMRGDVLLKGSAQPPWRRLWYAHDFPNAEKIVDNSYRLVDSGTGEKDCENLLYPIVPMADGVACDFEMLLEETTAKEAVVFRVANNAYVEMLCFEPEAITLKFQGSRIPFRTNDAFHRYRVETKGDQLKLLADGKLLAEVKMTMKADDDAARMTGNHTTIQYMQESSILVGSLSGPGTSVSRWRNVTLALPYIHLKDASLNLKFLNR